MQRKVRTVQCMYRTLQIEKTMLRFTMSAEENTIIRLLQNLERLILKVIGYTMRSCLENLSVDKKPDLLAESSEKNKYV